MKKEKLDLVLLLIYPVIASLLTLVVDMFFSTNYLFSILVFFGIPSMYLSYRMKKHILKSTIFSVIFGLPFALIIDYVAHINRTWFTYSMFSYRFLGQFPIESFLWAILYIYFIIMFYNYFLDKHIVKKPYNKRIKYFVLFLLILVVAFVLTLIVDKSYLIIPYFYLILGIVLGLIPILFVVLKFPVLLTKFLKITAYFFYLTFSYEVIALKLGWWYFPGSEFIGWVSFLGVSFPFEELFFWIILGAITVLSYYEFFDDDRK